MSGRTPTRPVLVPDGYYALDSEWRFVELNAVAERHFGRTAEELLGRNIWQETGRGPDSSVYIAFHEAVDVRQPVRFEAESRVRAGCWFEIHLQPRASGGLDVYFHDVTERRNADQRLHEQVEAVEAAHRALEHETRRLEAVLSALPVGVAITGSTGGNIRSNKAFDEVWGGPRPATENVDDYAAYKAWWADTGVAVSPHEWASARAVETGATVVGQLLEIQRFDGTRIFVSNSAAPVRDADGRIVGSAVAIQNVTAIRRANAVVAGIARIFREALACETEEQLGRVCLAVAEDVTQSRFGFVGEVNEATGRVDALAISDPGWVACQMHVSGREGSKPPLGFHIHGLYGAVLTRGEAFFTNEPNAHADSIGTPPGHPPLTAFLGVPLKVGTRTIGMVGLGNREGGYRPEDLHAAQSLAPAIVEALLRKRAEQSVANATRRFQTILDHAPVAIYVKDREGRFVLGNRQLCRFTGRPTEALLGKTDYDFAPKEDADRWRANDLNVLEGNRVREFEETGTDADGRAYVNLSVKFALPDPSGGPSAICGISTEITDRKRLEAQLRDQAEALERANRVKDEFLATLSHELRTPLNAILGWSDMLLRTELGREQQRKALESIRRNAQAQSGLIADILDVSRIITGKLHLDVRPVNMWDVVKSAVESLQPAADAKGISIRTSVDSRLVMIGDADRLQQIVWNLLSNSVKFTERGGLVEISLRRINSHLELQVSDTGIGIAPEFLPYVFERFRQFDSSTTRRHGGLGIGLAIVRSLTDLHGGTVAAYSEGEGKGATFTVTLPVQAVFDAPARDQRPDREPPAEAESVPDGCLHGLHVVAVDDEEEARALVRTVLERYGAHVTLCSSAQEAVDEVAASRPDLLLADVGMPDCDGYELIRRVRALADHHAQTLPAIALTAYGGADDRAQALSAGFWEHLTKPVMPVALVRAIMRLTGGVARQ